MSDIRETLDQLDRRLGELRRQIAELGRDAQPASDPVLQAPAPAQPPGPAPAPAPVQPPEPEYASTQIQQVMAVRDELLGGARELVRAYERQLDILERATRQLAAAAPGPSERQESPSTPTAQDPAQARPAFFEGSVTLAASGVHRIQTIQVLEDSLSRTRHVEAVYVRRWHRGQIWIELTLSAPVELIGELNRVLPFVFAVSSATTEEIVLRLEGER